MRTRSGFTTRYLRNTHTAASAGNSWLFLFFLSICLHSPYPWSGPVLFDKHIHHGLRVDPGPLQRLRRSNNEHVRRAQIVSQPAAPRPREEPRNPWAHFNICCGSWMAFSPRILGNGNARRIRQYLCLLAPRMHIECMSADNSWLFGALLTWIQ